jgi:hypothetical protein
MARRLAEFHVHLAPPEDLKRHGISASQGIMAVLNDKFGLRPRFATILRNINELGFESKIQKPDPVRGLPFKWLTQSDTGEFASALRHRQKRGISRPKDKGSGQKNLKK